jgi:uncharacterized membrane protein YhaH (DUF805 family)
MLGFLFGLNSRLGRLHFLLSMIGLGVIGALVVFALTGRVPQSGQVRGDIAFALNNGAVIIALIVLIVASLQLQCMRIRDIGWDPVCVMPGWFAMMIIDKLIATKFPALAIDYQHTGTAVGALANFALGLALLFWPTGDAGEAAPSSREPWEQSDTPPRGRSTPATTDRISRISNGRAG